MTGQATITLIHTNDLHSQLDRWPFMAAIIKAESRRAQAAGRPVIFVDAGDHLDMSNPISYGTTGDVNGRLLAAAECQAFTVGNNEYLRLRLSDLSRLAMASPFPWLGANMRGAGGTRIPGLQDWVIHKAGTVRVGFTGVQPLWQGAVASLGITPVDISQSIRDSVAAMRDGGVDLVVLMSHLGLEHDRALARSGMGIDLIIGAHTHEALHQPEVVAGVPIAQAGCFGEYVGVLEVRVGLGGTEIPDGDRAAPGTRPGSQTNRSHALLSCSGRLVPVNQEAGLIADPEAVQIIAQATREAQERLGELLTVLPAPLPHDPVGESRLGPLIAEALRRRASAEIGLVPGGQASTGFAAGPLTRAQVMDSLSPLWIPARLAMTGRQIAALLEQSEDPACYGHALWSVGMRPRGRSVGRIFTAGIACAIDASAPLGSRLQKLWVQGAPVDPGRVYTVGAPSVLGFAESGYSAAHDVQIVERYGPDFVREVFEAALRQGLASVVESQP